MTLKKFYRFIAILISGTIFFFLALFLFGNVDKYKDRPIFEENENRFLNTLPKISYERLKNGTVTSDLEKWTNDHFPKREIFMNIKAKMERFLQKTQINDVYLCKDNFLIERPKIYDRLDRVSEILKKFKSKIKCANVNLMLVPTAISIYSDKLPKNADAGCEIQNMNQIYEKTGISAIDVSMELKQSSIINDGTKKYNNLYYRLDHHWTTLGAFIAYQKYCKTLNIESIKFEQMNKRKISDDFKGTIYSKVNDFNIKGEPMYSYDNKNKVSIFYPDIDKIFDTMYEDEYLNKKDKYSYFLNNLHDYIEITNKDSSNDKELAVIKDSYANCLIPMLISHYKKIHVFDPRSYKKSISDFINSNKKIKDVLILYNMGTINNDTGIGGIL